MFAVAVPVRAGDSSGAFKPSAASPAIETGLFSSEVLSTFARPTSDLTRPEGDVIVLFVSV